MKKCTLLLPLLILSGCSAISLIETDSTPVAQSAVAKVETPAPQIITKEVIVEKPVYITKTKIIERDLSSKELAYSTDDIKDFSLNYSQKHYKFWVKYFTKEGSNKRRFHRHQKNGEKYRAIVEKVLKEHGLPPELFYVGLIESGFNTKIKSHANAVGPWQFIKGTAIRYDLKVNSSIDERQSIYKSTAAAARYFKDLYNIFGSWELALCAYNKGENGIIRAIRKGNTRDYRELVKKGLLPKETVYYIPKVAAAREIVNNREKYGFENYAKEQKKGQLYVRAEKRRLYRTFNVSTAAKKFKISKKSLYHLNPDIKRNKIRVSSRRPFELYIPKHSDVKLAEEIAPKLKKSKKRKYSYKRSSSKHKKYKVKRGDSLIAISKRFNIPVEDLIAINKIKKHRKHKIYVGQKIKIPSNSNSKIYRVRKGDNLTALSKKFGVSINKIVSVNTIRNKKIYIGQKLYIPTM